MAKIQLYCLLATCAVVTFCAKTNVDPIKDEKTTVDPIKNEKTGTDPIKDEKVDALVSKMDQDMKDEASMESRSDYDLMGAMNDCNDSFRIEMSYLESLNQSGSFPDETDKTPKCFLRCVLESLDIASPDGDFDPERTAMIFAGERNGAPMDGINEIATLCAERSEKCKCERSYNYLKCLFSMEIERYEKNS